jgi:anti-sigma B factor antagonist
MKVPRNGEQPAAISVGWRPDRGGLVRPVGELDIVNAQEFAEAIDKAAAGGRRPVLIDMSAVSFVDAAALGIMARAVELHRCRDGTPGIMITGANDHLAKVFNAVDLGHLLVA